VANGRVYVPTFSDQLVIYGLLASVRPTSNDLEVTAVVNAASLLAGPVAPGEVVTIFGAHIGPQGVSGMQVDGTSHATNLLAETQVLFDGRPAPLLYASSGEVGAVVPLEIAGPHTTLEVIYRGQKSAGFVLLVASAAPALFAQDGTGGGQGAIINADGSLNSGDNPADRGSVVVIYATGLGITSPLGDDGLVTGGSTLATPLLPITARIDGQPAEFVDAGAAPGMVQGMFQIKVRIPDGAASAYDDEVSLRVGDYASPTVVTVAVR